MSSRSRTSHRSTTYAFASLAASGLAVMDHRVAFQLRGDLWSDIQGCFFDFEKEQSVSSAKRVFATFPSFGDVLVYARSLDNLEKRLQWIVGEAPTAIADWQPEVPAVSPQLASKREANRKEIERLGELRKLAAQELLGHDCQHDRNVLAARRELGMP